MRPSLRLLLPVLLLVASACGNKSSKSPKEVAQALLSLHDLLGKSPEGRSKEAKEQEVDRDELDELIVDLSKYDKFTGDLFVGVVVGALAKHQARITEKINGETAILTAGNASIQFDLVQGEWKINLARTIPSEMKERAIQEKLRYEAAREAGKALGGSGR